LSHMNRRLGGEVKRKGRVGQRKKYPPATVDSEGKLPLPEEMVRALRIRVGERYAVWKKGRGYVLVFPKRLRRRTTIPKDALWGKVEP
jgi:hypothetical protein